MPASTKRRTTRRSRLGSLLRSARLAQPAKKERTRSAAARAMRAVPNTINNWENGLRPNQAAWPHIAAYLRLSVEDVQRLAPKRGATTKGRA